MKPYEADTARGADDKIRALLRQYCLVPLPRTKRGPGRPPKNPLPVRSRADQILESFKTNGHYSYKQYSRFGTHNYEGLLDDGRTYRVSGPGFVTYLIASYPHTLFEWVKVNTGWLKEEPDPEEEPSLEELQALEESAPELSWFEQQQTPAKPAGPNREEVLHRYYEKQKAKKEANSGLNQ